MTDDLALVTACRHALRKSPAALPRPSFILPKEQRVVEAALSLIEDTLNRHAPTDRYSHDADTGPHCAECSRNSGGRVITADHPCPTYNDALAALHTIATALGVDPTKEET